MTAAAYDGGSGGLRHKGDNGLQQWQSTAAAYNGGGSGLPQQKTIAVAYADEGSVDND